MHSGNEALHGIHQVILEAGATNLPVCEDVHANASLTL
jgi:hypothetical protein